MNGAYSKKIELCDVLGLYHNLLNAATKDRKEVKYLVTTPRVWNVLRGQLGIAKGDFPNCAFNGGSIVLIEGVEDFMAMGFGT